MHFRPAFPDDFIAALAAIKNAGLTPALLEDYVSLAPGTAAAASAVTVPDASTARHRPTPDATESPP